MDVDGATPALEQLLAQAAWVRRLARSLTSEAEDVAQDAFVAALERPPRSGANLRAWLARVLANRARSAGRAASRRARRERASARAEALPSAAELAAELEWQRRIASAVLELDEPYRTALLLHFYRGLAPAEIARRRGEPPATVRSHLKRGLDRLRARFDGEHGDRRAWSAVLAAWSHDEPELALAAGSGLLVAAALGLLLLAGGGAWLAWSARASSASVPLTLVAAAPLAPPAAKEQTGASAPAPAPAPVQETPRVPASSAAPPAAAQAASGPLFVGIVRDPDGQPIAGAALRLYPDGSRPRPEALGRGVSGPDGRFAFTALPSTSTDLTIGAEAAGFAGMTMGALPEEELEIELRWSVELFGVVRDAASARPLAGVELANEDEASVFTDAEGNYRLGGFPSGLSRSLRARLAGYAAVAHDVLPRGKAPQRFDLELTPGTAIEVEVFDRESGAALAGAEVHDPRRKQSWASSDSRGRFTTWIAPEQPLDLDVTRAGYWPLTWRWTPGAELAGAAPRLPMAREIWITGGITDESGAPAAAEWLYAEYQDSYRHKQLEREVLAPLGTPGTIAYGMRELPREVTDAFGSYRLPILPSASPFTLKAGAKGFVTVEHGPLVFSSSTRGTVLDLVLARAATVHGRALRDGKSWHGRVWRQGPDGTPRFAAWVRGEYTMTDLPAGTWTLSLRDDQGNEETAATLTVDAGGTYEHDFVWGQEVALGTIAGRVLLASGLPARDAHVYARETGDPRARAETAQVAEDGSFVVRVPAGGSYTVSAARWTKTTGVTSDARVVVPDAEGIELELPDVGRLRLCLVDASTGAAVQPRSRFLVNALGWKRPADEHFQTEHLEIDLDGCVELELPAGPCEIRVDLIEEGYLPLAPLAAVVGVPSGAPRVVALVRGIELGLRLIGPPGSDAPGDHLFFLVERGQLGSIAGPFPAEGGPPWNNRINGICMRLDDGALLHQLLADENLFTDGAVLRALAPGHYFLKSYPDDFVFEPAELDLAGPERAEVQVRWRPK